jgi:hypothetical protein
LPGLNSEEKALAVLLDTALNNARNWTRLLLPQPGLWNTVKDGWAVVKHKTRYKNFHLVLRYSNNYAFLFCLHLVYFISIVCLF